MKKLVKKKKRFTKIILIPKFILFIKDSEAKYLIILNWFNEWKNYLY